MRKLFLSFTGMLEAIRDQRIMKSDLDNGLFFFLCHYNNVFCDPNDGHACEIEAVFGPSSPQGAAISRAVRRALAKATEEGRAKWWSRGEEIVLSPFLTEMYQLLNELLSNNGYRPLCPHPKNYDRRKVEQLIKLQKVPLIVVGPPAGTQL